MKARWLSAKERAAAKVVAEQLMDKQADDIKTRAERCNAQCWAVSGYGQPCD